MRTLTALYKQPPAQRPHHCIHTRPCFSSPDVIVRLFADVEYGVEETRSVRVSNKYPDAYFTGRRAIRGIEGSGVPPAGKGRYVCLRRFP